MKGAVMAKSEARVGEGGVTRDEGSRDGKK
jgi:hypothetical protein